MNYDDMNNNRVVLAGTVISKPIFSHEVMGEGFYEFDMSILRLSMQEDTLPITISERLMSEVEVKEGSKITITGQFRSYNKLDSNKSRLMLTVFARTISEYDPEVNPNTIELEGFICKQPMYRTTPFKREICDLLVAVNRAYNKSDYIPCIAWGRNARFVNSLTVGERISVVGRIQSREYQKITENGTVTKTAYEVSISRITADSCKEPLDINDDCAV